MLNVLYLHMNPCADDELSYRRKLILSLPQVKRIDHSPCRPSAINITQGSATVIDEPTIL
jgi:hypothetical protein